METKKLNWSKGNGMLPAIIQDFNSKDILMLGIMNEEALERTLSEIKLVKSNFTANTVNNSPTALMITKNIMDMKINFIFLL